jgi:solute:Na+ symporter, SSS family
METHFTSLDGAVLALYFAATMAVGFLVRRRSASVEGFTAADRSLPGWLCGMSILATYVSSISFLALPGRAYSGNWNSFVFSLSLPLAAWIGVRWLVPFYRRGGHVSAYAHLEERFGPWARAYASACYLLTQLARIGTVTYLMALPLHILLGWDIRLIILATALATITYTFFGGIRAVIYADAVQTVVLVCGALICLGLMVFGLPEGPGQLLRIAGEHGKFSLGSFGPDLTTATFWVVLVYGLFINLQNFGIDQNYVQRYLAAKSDAQANQSLLLGALLYLPLSAVFFLIGTSLFAYYTAQPGLLPAELLDPQRADSVFPYFIVTVLPPGVTGLLIAAIFAAAMSTISTSLNSSATILLNDYYRRFVNPGAGERKGMRFLRAATVGWGLLGLLVALAMIEVRSALDAWWSMAGIFSGGMLGLFLLGQLARAARPRAAITGVVAGVAVILWMTLSPRWESVPGYLRSPFHSFLIIVFGTLAILLAGFLATALFQRRRTPS